MNSSNSKINKGNTPPKSTSIDEEEEGGGQLELYSPKYAQKMNNTTYQKKPDEEKGQLELYSPEYSLQVNNSKVKDDEEVNKKMMKQKHEVQEKEKKAAPTTKGEDGPLATPLPVRLTSRI